MNAGEDPSQDEEPAQLGQPSSSRARGKQPERDDASPSAPAPAPAPAPVPVPVPVPTPNPTPVSARLGARRIGARAWLNTPRTRAEPAQGVVLDGLEVGSRSGEGDHIDAEAEAGADAGRLPEWPDERVSSGPSTAAVSTEPPRTPVRVRIRPVTVRFTEAGVVDLETELRARIVHSKTGGEGAAGEAGLREDESVRAFKGRIREARPALNLRRLRLIHAGRILSDGTQLVSWLDALDSHKRAQAARAEAAGAAGPRAWVARLERELAEDVSGDEEDEAESESSSLLTGKNERQSVGKRKGKEKAGDGEIAQEEVEDREEERVYIQCSVGDVMDEAEQLAERHEADAGRSGLGPDGTEPGEGTSAAARGFDRLRGAGFSDEDIADMRAQFYRATGLDSQRSGNVLDRNEEDEHARALEEQWIDNMGENNGSGPGLEGGSDGFFQTILEGLLTGFFFPLIPLFFFRERAHPSAFPRSDPRNPSMMLDEDDEDDGEGAGAGAQGQARGGGAAAAAAGARSVVFSKNMQIAIVFGLAANVIFGAFRSLW